MAVHTAVGVSRRGQGLRHKSSHLPAPMGGLDARQSLSQGDPNFALYNYNLTPTEYGCKIRKGYREFATGVPGSAGIRTLIPYHARSVSAVDKLFAVTNNGIYDITAGGDMSAAVLKYTFSDTSSSAGYGNFVAHTNTANSTVLLYADSKNGLIEYDEATNTWAAVTGVTGPTVADIRFVMSFKERIWVVEENSVDAWYFAIGARTGTATQYQFGSKMKIGGELIGLWNWTVDGGNGIDDFLVALSSGGDVLVYQGYDPSAASTFENIGTFDVGQPPAGHRMVSEYGGNLSILTAFGLVSMADLLQGVDARATKQDSIVALISRIIRQRMRGTITEEGWEARFVPSEGIILLAMPRSAGDVPGQDNRDVQLVMNIDTAAWGFWRDLDIWHGDTWNSTYYFITPGGDTVYAQDSEQDGVLLAGTGGTAIEFSVLTSFSALGEPGIYKRVEFIRPQFWANAAPDVTIRARYDFDLSEASYSGAFQGSDESLWDAALWDVNLWGTGEREGSHDVEGSLGYGRYIAIAMKGSGLAGAIFVGWDINWQSGGFL